MASRCCSVACCVLASLLYTFFVSVVDASPLSSVPKDDCSTLVMNMADCLPFVSNGSTLTKPEGTCCSGLKKVLQTDASCICKAFHSNGQLEGLLNISKALTLPAACKIHNAPPASNCGLALAPAGGPASHASNGAPGPSSSGRASAGSPLGSPVTGGSNSISISYKWLLFGVFAALMIVF